jgi:hypothetical protein
MAITAAKKLIPRDIPSENMWIPSEKSANEWTRRADTTSKMAKHNVNKKANNKIFLFFVCECS